MTYELARRLKDAGFPQDKSTWVYRDSVNLVPRLYIGVIWPDDIAAPIVEEFIEVLKAQKKHFILQHVMGRYSGWTAIMGPAVGKRGSSPLEALTNLYIAIKELSTVEV